jgi:hypothetical protein
MWYPIEGTNLPTAEVAGQSNVPVAIKAADAPPAADLRDWVQSEKDLALTEALSLGFAAVTADQDASHRTIILDAMRYADKDNIRWGVGARLTLHAWSESGSIKGAVALVAAQASLNLVYTRTTFQVMGYSSAELTRSLPGFEEMTVSNYTDLIKAIDTCKNAVMSAAPEDLTPQPVAVFLPAPPPAEAAPRWPFHVHHAR